MCFRFELCLLLGDCEYMIQAWVFFDGLNVMGGFSSQWILDAATVEQMPQSVDVANDR
jgi:hypothetical protein